MSDVKEYGVILCTAGSDTQAEQIARALVDRRLAACVNIVSHVCSVYRWKGEVVREEEKLLLIKTRGSLYAEVEAAIRELHSYEVPEVLMLDVDRGARRYLDWLAGETGPAGDERD